jgi:hypothetical protein
MFQMTPAAGANRDKRIDCRLIARMTGLDLPSVDKAT